MRTTPLFPWLVAAALVVIGARLAARAVQRVRRARRELRRRRPLEIRFAVVDHATPRIRAVRETLEQFKQLAGPPRQWH